MLITISGMVGSGKSTTARTVVERLSGAGLSPQYVRFRYLPLLGFAQPARHDPAEATSTGSSAVPLRGQGFRSRPLSAVRALGYAARILSFRLSGVGRSGRCVVVDRYFYDNFAQYDLRSTRERLYVSVLRRLMPRPDLAILLLASDATIARRRANYAPEYVTAVARRYHELPRLFPELTTVMTDDDSEDGGTLERAIQRLVGRLAYSTRT